MKKNVLISLTDTAELILTLRIYSGLKFSYRSANWSLVTWSEHRELVQLFGHVDRTCFIDRALIGRTMNSPVFPDSYALNMVWDEIADLVREEHDWVISVSNNSVAGFLSSMLNKKQQVGLYFNDQGNVTFDDYWSKYTNEVFTQHSAAFNRYDLLRLMCGLNNENIPILNINEADKYSIAQKFSQIREKNHGAQFAKKIVGIDFAAFANKEDDLAEVVFNLLGSKSYFPVVLIQKNNQAQYERAKAISTQIENRITTIEYDLGIALPMLFNLDALLTSGGVLKQLAHLTETPTLSIKENLINNTGYSYIQGDLILQASINKVGSDSVLCALDMLTGGKVKKGENLPIEPLFQVVKDDWGHFLLQVNSQDKNAGNIAAYLIRILMIELSAGKSIDVSKSWVMQLFERDELDKFIHLENERIDESIHTVLSMIRIIPELHKGDAHFKKFFMNLDVLINVNKITGVSTLVRALFRPPMLSVQAGGAEGLRELEAILLDLKNNLSTAQMLLRRIARMYVHTKMISAASENPPKEF